MSLLLLKANRNAVAKSFSFSGGRMAMYRLPDDRLSNRLWMKRVRCEV